MVLSNADPDFTGFYYIAASFFGEGKRVAGSFAYKSGTERQTLFYVILQGTATAELHYVL